MRRFYFDFMPNVSAMIKPTLSVVRFHDVLLHLFTKSRTKKFKKQNTTLNRLLLAMLITILFFILTITNAQNSQSKTTEILNAIFVRN